MGFPIINHIDDVLPALKGRDEFRIVRKPAFTYIDYNFILEDTFSCPIRRECRGIKFYPDGSVMARPLHKFFNMNENESVRFENLPWASGWTAYTKLDGSMIHAGHEVLGSDRKLVPMTMAGYTEVAQQVVAEGLWNETVQAFCSELMDKNLTAIFEYVSPENRIVVDYATPSLELLAIRNNTTGEYVDRPFDLGGDSGYFMMYEGAMQEDPASFVSSIRAYSGTDEEGVVIRFADNETFVKLKSDDYVLMHKAKDQISLEKNRIKMFIENKLDDILPILSEKERTALVSEQEVFFDHRNKVRHGVREFVRILRNMYGDNRKAFAQENTKEQPVEWQALCWAEYDGNLDTAFDKLCKKATVSQKNIDRLREVGILPPNKKGENNEQVY